jgi:hypothetical protein
VKSKRDIEKDINKEVGEKRQKDKRKAGRQK